jgi:hypothetical protein
VVAFRTSNQMGPAPQLGYNSFLPNLFHLIIHQAFYDSTLYILTNMALEGSLPCPQKFSTGPYLVPDESILHLPHSIYFRFV